MAYEEALVGVSLNAGADLSAKDKQYTALKVNANGEVISSAAATDASIGLLQNLPKQGEPAKVGISGISKAKTGAAITAGAYVASNAAGLIVTASAGNKIIGTALVTAASGDIIPVLLAPPGTAAA